MCYGSAAKRLLALPEAWTLHAVDLKTSTKSVLTTEVEKMRFV